MDLTVQIRHFPRTSAESARIRAELPRPLFDPSKTTWEEREDWEDSVRDVVLPPSTLIEPLDADGVYCEKVSCEATRTQGVLLFFHGGGYNAGSCMTHREFAARISRAIGLPVLLAQYRLAPENPFPDGLNDCMTVYRWLVRNGTAPKQVVFGGDSAGGGLVAAMLLALKQNGGPMPAAGVLLSAWLDLSVSGESYQSRKDVDPTVHLSSVDWAAREYVGTRDVREPLISPLLGDLTGLPPLLIQVGDHEVFLSDSVTLAENAARAGVSVELQIWDEMWHVFQAWSAALPEGRAALDQVARFLQQHLST